MKQVGRIGYELGFTPEICRRPHMKGFTSKCWRLSFVCFAYYTKLLWPQGQTYIGFRRYGSFKDTTTNQTLLGALENGVIDTDFSTYQITEKRLRQFTMTNPEPGALRSQLNVYYNTEMQLTFQFSIYDRTMVLFRTMPTLLWIVSGLVGSVFTAVVVMTSSPFWPRIYELHVEQIFGLLVYCYNMNLKMESLGAFYRKPLFNDIDKLIRLIEAGQVRPMFYSNHSSSFRATIRSNPRLAETLKMHPPIFNENVTVCQALSSPDQRIVYFTKVKANLWCDSSCVAKSDRVASAFPIQWLGIIFKKHSLSISAMNRANILLHAYSGMPRNYLHDFRMDPTSSGKCSQPSRQTLKRLKLSDTVGKWTVLGSGWLTAFICSLIERNWEILTKIVRRFLSSFGSIIIHSSSTTV